MVRLLAVCLSLLFLGVSAHSTKLLPDGSINGFFAHSRHLFWQNEDTDKLKNLVDRRSFDVLVKEVEPTAKSPLQSLKLIEPRPGFTVELMAAEPLVMDPVAFEWGPDGKLWVAEMADYPLGVPEKDKQQARSASKGILGINAYLWRPSLARSEAAHDAFLARFRNGLLG